MPVLYSCHLSVPSRVLVKSEYFKMNTVRYRHSSFRTIIQGAEPHELVTQELTRLWCFLLPTNVPKCVFWYLPLSPEGCTAVRLDEIGRASCRERV